jgi:hypothetical protein
VEPSSPASHGDPLPPDEARADPPPGALSIPARLGYHGRPFTPATAWVVERSRRAQLGRSLRGLALCWGAAIVAIFIPLAHFLLVPALLVAGPLLAVARLREERTLVAAHGVCPGCGHEQSFAARGRFHERFAVRCAACRREIVLEPEPV